MAFDFKDKHLHFHDEDDKEEVSAFAQDFELKSKKTNEHEQNSCRDLQ